MTLTEAQLKNEIARCQYCEEKPCKEACPADCSPADFLMAAAVGGKSDYGRAAALILGNNPLGGVCGLVCPEKHCMAACARKTFDAPVNIPAAQAAIIAKARELGALPEFAAAKPNGKKVAVAGAGPAGLAAAAVLAQKGYAVDVYEREKTAGGMAGLVPDFRLDKAMLRGDIDFIKSLGRITFKTGVKLSPSGKYDAVIIAAGLDMPFKLGIPGENLAVSWVEYLRHPGKFHVKNHRVAVIGGGAVAADCAETAARRGAARVEMFCLEKLSEMPLEQGELRGLLDAGIAVSGRTRIAEIISAKGKITGLKTVRVELSGRKFSPSAVKDAKNSAQELAGFDFVIVAVGARSSQLFAPTEKVFVAGDAAAGPSTVVEAAASGKNVAIAVDKWLSGEKKRVEKAAPAKSRAVLAGRNLLPVPLEAEFFGRKILSPFLLSAAPPSDGYEQMRKAYQAGWAGGVMKTSFDNIPIHIPSEYMVAFTQNTYGNCDNVSGHHLDRVCGEIGRLRREFPDRLTMASTGGPVTGNDEADKKVWQSNTKKLEAAGALGIEYSLSCPQGGDGTKGDIVSQDAELTAKIIGWVMEVSDPEIPKLFKLTAAVTSIYPIMAAIKEAFAKYPGKKAGVTLANTFPALALRKGAKKNWEEGIVVGMSGEGVAPISNLTLANVSRMGMAVSGNGGPMNYRQAADFLALGARTVQFCTVAVKHGCGVIDELHSGLSFLMKERGIKSVAELVGRALPNPVTGFMELSPEKKISDVNADLCQHCGNCSRCSYMAIELDKNKVPRTDAARCVGCSICVQKCFSGALFMRQRTAREKTALKED
ncbi:MAG: FAD-dependent oxidoreductase [Elusimicrobiales bacterium]